ncbi:MAG: FlgD immunoglobulin-like domain containing protein [bacterium]
MSTTPAARWMRGRAVLFLTVLCLGLLTAVTAGSQPVIVEPGWTLVRSIAFTAPISACYNPVDGAVYVGRRGTSTDGLYRIDGLGFATRISTGSNTAGVAVQPDSGSVFQSEDYGGIIYRTALGATGRATWVSGFQAGDDDPIGMAFAPFDYAGDVLAPGKAVVVDRGNSGPDVIWTWSPFIAEAETLLHADTGILIDAVDVAIDRTGVFVVDSGLTAAGVIYEVGTGGVLTAVATSDILPDPQAIAIDPWTDDLLVLDQVDDRVVRIGRTDGVVTVVAAGLNTTLGWAGIDISPDGRWLVLTSNTDGKIFVLGRCDATGHPELDCDGNGIHDLCDIALGAAEDCNANGIPDTCDLDSGTSEDCDLNGIPDECPTCPPVEVVFVMDTSTSMDDEASALCANMTQVVEQLEAAGLTVMPSLLGICDLPGGAYGCLENHVTALLGTEVPGAPPAGLEFLGSCPGGMEVCQEDWGLATAVVAGRYPWLPRGESVRLIVPLSDEGSWCGDPVTTFDQQSVDHAVVVARQNKVVVSPITGSGSSSAVIALAQTLADSTGGIRFSSAVPAADLAEGIVDLVLEACFAFIDCNGNGTLDACDISAGISEDTNGNGIPDECEGASAVPDGARGARLYRLDGNYPNPFNALTRFDFELMVPAQVALRVYSLDGRLVRTVLQEYLEAGPHFCTWNGRDDRGRTVASGGYFYRFQAGDQAEVRRMVLLK